MKAIKIFGLLLFAAFAFNSCSDDDEEDPIDLTGTMWETLQVVTSNSLNSITQTHDGDELETFYMDQILEFKADGTFSIYDSFYDETLQGTWVQNGSIVTVTIGDDDEIRIYSVSGSTLMQKVISIEGDFTTTEDYTYVQIYAS